MEERELRQAQVRDYIRKREAGATLATQRLAQLRGSAKAVALSPAEGGVVRYGDVVQLRSERTGLALAVDLLEVLRTDPDSGEEHRAVTTSPTATQPSIRNAFVIVPYGEESGGDGVVRFGEQFLLATHSDCPMQLFVSSHPQTPTLRAKASGFQECVTSQRANFSCAWKFVFVDPQMRLENEGQPVPAGARVLITHCQTGINLAADNTQAKCVSLSFPAWCSQITTSSDYGLEFEVFCRTVLDFKKAEQTDNLWTVVMA